MSAMKLCIVGLGGSGKSAITLRYLKNEFISRYDPTIEDTYRKLVQVEDTAYQLEIMDTAGQEEYRALRDQYMKDSEGYLVIYSIDSTRSFENVTQMISQIKRIKEQFAEVPIVICGNKCDLPERSVTAAMAQELATTTGYKHFEVSAKTALNIKEAFAYLIKITAEWRIKYAAPTKSKKKQKCIIM